MAGLNRPAVSQQHCAFHQVLQFAHIAGKVILLQPCNGAFRKGSGRQLIFTRIHAYKKSGQFQHVIPAFAQRRQTQGNNVQPKIQVLTELALFYPAFKIAVGCGKHAHINLDGLGAAHAVDLALLKHTEELCLQGQIHFRNFIKQEGAAIGKFKLARLAGNGASERTFLVPKKLALKQVFRQGGAVHSHKGLLRSLAHGMQIAGKHFLTSTRFAGNQHCSARSGHLTGQLQHPGNGGVITHNARPGAFVTGLVPAKGGHCRNRDRLALLACHSGDAVHIQRFKPVILRAQPHEPFGLFRVAFVRNHDDRRKIGIFRANGKQIFHTKARQ